jgi:hypothetical protein
MTQEEFNATKFKARMKALVNGKEKDIISVDFERQMIGLEIADNSKKIDWVRIENLELVKDK